MGSTQHQGFGSGWAGTSQLPRFPAGAGGTGEDAVLQKLLRLFASLSAGRTAVCRTLSLPWELLGRGSFPGLPAAGRS